MRLAYATTNPLLTMYELPTLTVTASATMLTNLLHAVLINAPTRQTYIDLFNVLIDPLTTGIAPLEAHAISAPHLTTITYLSYVTPTHLYAQVFTYQTALHTPTWFALNATLTLNWTLATTMLILYSLMLLWGLSNHVLNPRSASHAKNIITLHLFMFIWLFASLDKLETTEEALSLAILWPWCFLIVFTHLVALADHSILFGFSEWGLPVTYGLIMLTEHAWTLGTYLFVYLAGTRSRKVSILAALEDITALLILIARVLLQAVRGVIVGMFHFISRELLWNMSKFWTTNTSTAATTSTTPASLTPKYYILDILISGGTAAGSFVIITGIMFLQLIFLLVSVWLFCKCWFISWRKC